MKSTSEEVIPSDTPAGRIKVLVPNRNNLAFLNGDLSDIINEQEELIAAIASLLEEMIRQAKPTACYTLFHCRTPPSISIREYLMRILKYAKCSVECFVIALIHLDHIKELHS
jgi:hypothetical protein